MSPGNGPYEQFGSFLLFQRIENDALGDLWRAGRIEGSGPGTIVAIRRLLHGRRDVLRQAAETAQPLVPLLTGSTFAKDQEIEVIEGVPCIVHEYAGGRSLRYIVDRSRGGPGSPPHPLPLDQATAIAEKIALSLATTADLRYLGNRLAHGALIPHFVWISDEGEIRVAGQQLGSGLVASLSDPRIASEISPYLAPEYQASGEVSKTTDVYSLGALLYLLLTGTEPPAGSSASTQAIASARTTTGQLMPEEWRAILAQSLALDPTQRFASIGDMKQAVSAITHGGRYSATTFNLAFYLNSLLAEELEREAIDREKESRTGLTPSLATGSPLVAAVSTPRIIEERPMFETVTSPKSNRTAMMAIGAAILLLAAAAGFYLLHRPAAASAVVVAASPRTPSPAKSPAMPPPVVSVSSAPPAGGNSLVPSGNLADPAAAKKAFELAVQQKLQEEMLKLQSDYNQQLKQEQSKNAPVRLSGAVPAPVPRETTDLTASSASTFDQQRVNSRQETSSTASTPAAATRSPVIPTPIAAQPEPGSPGAIREGDVIDLAMLDSPPQPLSPIRAEYPRLAKQQRAQATVILSALVSETGNVLEVKILRGDARFGFNEAATRAMKSARFSPPMKDGKSVRTWRPQTFAFSL